MMKKFNIIIILFLPFGLFSQVTESVKTAKYEIGITYSPDYCYRSLKPDAASKWIADIRDTLEIPKFGYTTGLDFINHLNKKIAVEAAILLSDKGERTKKYSVENPISEKLPSDITLINHYYYLDIPIKLNYYILTEKIKFFVTAGISTTIFLNKKTVTVSEYTDGTTAKSQSTSEPEFRRFNFAVIAGLGMDCSLSDKFNLKIEPLYRRSINSIIDAPIKTYFYSAGLNIGIFYKI